MSHSTITMNFSAVEPPDIIGPPAPPYTYIGVAQQYLVGVNALGTSPEVSNCAMPLCHLTAHALECALTAYLTRGGSDRDIAGNRRLRHNLVALWNMAQSEGLDIPGGMPGWVAQLGALHDYPFRLRYAKDVHALVLPVLQPMIADLDRIIGLIQKQVAGS